MEKGGICLKWVRDENGKIEMILMDSNSFKDYLKREGDEKNGRGEDERLWKKNKRKKKGEE